MRDPITIIDVGAEFDLGEICIIIPLPCGCVAEGKMCSERGFFTCPWCEATFDVQAFKHWLNGGATKKIYLERGPKPMLRFSETANNARLFEIVAEHGGLPVVKMGQDLVVLSDSFERVAN